RFTPSAAPLPAHPPMNLLPGALDGAGDAVRLRVGSLALPLTGWSITLARGKLLVGIRPEDLYEPSAKPPGDHLLPLAVRVVAVEPLGAETLLLLALDGTAEEMIARVGRETGLRVGSPATIFLDAKAAHLFDLATG